MKMDQKSFETSSPVPQKRGPGSSAILMAFMLIALGFMHLVGDAVIRGSSAAAASVQSAQTTNYGD